MDYRIPGTDIVLTTQVVYQGAQAGNPFHDDDVPRRRAVLNLSDDDHVVVRECSFEGQGSMYLRAEELENTLMLAANRIAHDRRANCRGRLILQVDTRTLTR